MNRRDLEVFFVLEILAIVWAAALFNNLENKLMAGYMAGGYFVISGAYMLFRTARWPQRWSSPTWYLLFIHVFLISLPLLITRMIHSEIPFEDVRILGVSGPVFHKISSVTFSMLIGATVIDWVRAKWIAKARPKFNAS